MLKTYRSLKAIVAKHKNFLFGFNIRIDLKYKKARSGNNGTFGI